MKKLLLSLIVFVSCFSGLYAQQDSTTVIESRRHELRVNALLLIAGLPEVGYEYLLNEESGIGATALVSLSDNIDLNWYIAPYYRFYFGKKYAAGFFAEGFTMLNSYERSNFDFFSDPSDTEDSENVLDLALGIGFGGKWITRRGIIFELSLGFGRNLFNNDDEEFNNDYEFTGKGGISIGYRF